MPPVLDAPDGLEATTAPERFATMHDIVSDCVLARNVTEIFQCTPAGGELAEWTVRCDCGWHDRDYPTDVDARLAAMLHQLAGAMAHRPAD